MITFPQIEILGDVESMAVLLSQSIKPKSEDEVKRWITPERETIIRDCILSAVEEYRTEYSRLRYKHSSRTDASTIHDLMLWNVESRFENDPEVRCMRKRNLFTLNFGNGDVIIRFKKMDKRLNTHNNHTQQSFEFSHQITLFEPSINLNAGYQFVGLGVKVFITCPIDSKNNSWVWELTVVPSENVHEMPKKETPAPRREFKAKKESVVDEEGKPTTN